MDPVKRKYSDEDSSSPDPKQKDQGIVTRRRGEPIAEYEKRLVEAYGPYIFIKHPTGSQSVHLTEQAKLAKDLYFKAYNARKNKDIQRRQENAILHDRIEDRPLMTEPLYDPKYKNLQLGRDLKKSIETIENKVREWSKDRSRLLAIDKLTPVEHQSLPPEWKTQRSTLRHQVRNAENALNLLYGKHIYHMINAERLAKLQDEVRIREQAHKNPTIDALQKFLTTQGLDVGDPSELDVHYAPSPSPEASGA